MNVWIFVITALLTPQAPALLAPRAPALLAPRAPALLAPIAEPLGLSPEAVAPTTMAAPFDVEPRFHGLERMLAELDASQP